MIKNVVQFLGKKWNYKNVIEWKINLSGKSLEIKMTLKLASVEISRVEIGEGSCDIRFISGII
jgi:hypothetical protein